MRLASIAVATLLALGGPGPAALGGPGPAALLALAFGAVYAARSPDRLLDALYAAAFCGLGYLAG